MGLGVWTGNDGAHRFKNGSKMDNAVNGIESNNHITLSLKPGELSTQHPRFKFSLDCATLKLPI